MSKEEQGAVSFVQKSINFIEVERYLTFILFSSSTEITIEEGARGPVTVLLPFVIEPRPESFPNKLSSI